MTTNVQQLSTRRAPLSADGWLPPEDLLVRPEFISESDRTNLVAWALSMKPFLKDNGPGRSFRKVEELPTIDPVHTAVRLKLQALLKVGPDAEPEPMFGWYLSIISDGGAVHPHMDPAPPNMRHLRCNIFLQVPESGGLPFIERRPVAVRERTLLCFFPSERRHSSQPAGGDRQRIILSFGYLVSDDYRLPHVQVENQARSA